MLSADAMQMRSQTNADALPNKLMVLSMALWGRFLDDPVQHSLFICLLLSANDNKLYKHKVHFLYILCAQYKT